MIGVSGEAAAARRSYTRASSSWPIPAFSCDWHAGSELSQRLRRLGHHSPWL